MATVNRSSTTQYWMLAGLQVVDVATTWFILAHWSARTEGNPVVATGCRAGGSAVCPTSLPVP